MSESRAVVAHNVVPMRAEPGAAAEQVSQAVFGETVRVLRHEGDHAFVQTPDSYEGWVLGCHIALLEIGELYPDPARAALVAPLFLPLFREPSGRSERLTLLTLGSVVEVAPGSADAQFYPVRLPRGGIGYVDNAGLIVPQYPALGSLGPNLAIVARGLIGVPYLWGGRTPFGLDCSGLTQRVYWLCGQSIPRDAHQQADSDLFEPIDRQDARAGDLLFFGGAIDPHGRGIAHVGMALDDGRFVHACGSGGVIATPIDEPEYLERYCCARRLLGSGETE